MIKLLLILTVLFTAACDLKSTQELIEGPATFDGDQTSLGDGEGTPITDPPGELEDDRDGWEYGSATATLPLESGSSYTIDGDDQTEDIPNSFQSHEDGEGWSIKSGLSIFGKVKVENPTAKTFFRWCVDGKDARQRSFVYCVRSRRGRTEVYFKGAHGSFVKRIQNGFIEGEIYKVNFLFYKDAIALFFSHEEYEKWNPNHVIYLPIEEGEEKAVFRFSGEVKEGKVLLTDVNISEKSGGQASQNISSDISGFETDSKVKTLVTKEIDLSPTWTFYQSNQSYSSNFYKTNYGFDADENLYDGSFYEYSGSIFGGNFKLNRQTGKIIRWKFKTKSLEKFHARFRLFGRNASKNLRYHDIILNQRHVNFWNYVIDPVLSSQERVESRRINSVLEPETNYVLEFLIFEGGGNAVYVYKDGEQRPTSPSQIFISDDWEVSTRFQIYRGSVTDLKQEILDGSQVEGFDLTSNGFQSYTQNFLEDIKTYKTEFIPAPQKSHLVSYRNSQEKSIAADDHYVYENGSTIQMKSNGTRYMKFRGENVYNRSVGLKKGVSLKVKFNDPDFDPIMILALEGRDKEKVYVRYGNVFRKTTSYVQMRAFRPFTWRSWRIASRGEMPDYWPQNYPLRTNYDIQAKEYRLKLEPYGDGYALWFWAEGDSVPEEPVHILENNQADTLNFAAWIYRGKATISDLTYYDISRNSVAETYTLGNEEKTFVTAEKKIFDEDSIETVVDSGESEHNCTSYDSTTNTYSLRGNEKNYAVHYSHRRILFRERGTTISLKVLAKNAQDKSYTGMTFGLHGSSRHDPVSRRYRRHVVRFWENDIYAETYGSGVHGYSGHKVATYEDNTWYNVEYFISKIGSHLTIWKDGSEKPANPQSVFFLSDWDARFVTWIKSGEGKLKDLKMQIPSSPDLSHYIPTYGNDLNYMGATLDPKDFSDIVSEGSEQNIVANKDIDESNFGCFYNISSNFYEEKNSMYLIKSDNARYWDGFSCPSPIERKTTDPLRINFTTRDELMVGSRVILGVTGYGNTSSGALRGHRTYRRLALRVYPHQDTIRADVQYYSPFTGWSYSSPVTLEKSKGHELVISTSNADTVLSLTDSETNNEILSHSMKSVLSGDHVSEAIDFTPYLFLRLNKDHFKINSIEYKGSVQ